MVDHWIEMCTREAEQDTGSNTETRIAAVTLLCELWINFTSYVDSKESLQSAIIYMMKRVLRDRQRSLRMVAIALFFKILDKFSETRN